MPGTRPVKQIETRQTESFILRLSFRTSGNISYKNFIEIFKPLLICCKSCHSFCSINCRVICRALLAIEEIAWKFKQFSYPSCLLKCSEELLEVCGPRKLSRPLTTVQLEALYMMKENTEQLRTDMNR